MKKESKTVVVSGCTKGIGRSVCEAFAAGGFNVAGFARNKKDVADMTGAFEKKYPGQLFYFAPADASRHKDLKHFTEKVLRLFGGIDILVNNAGVFLPGNIADEKKGQLETVMETNLYSAYHLSREILPHLIKRKSGLIFNMCSIASLQAYKNGGSYAISKFALLGFSRQLRLEMMPHNIKVTSIIPGATLTDSWAGTELDESRFIQPTDIAQTMFNIASLSGGANVDEVIIRPQYGDI
jgi:NAD(P)-dependent dehydrogenase (short-subunit alcohol dehydrogenase family)